MKKLLYGLICTGLLSGSMVSAAMSPKEMWRCLTKPSECPEAKRKEARAWVIGVPVAVIVAVLAAVGIIVAKNEIQNMKQANQQAAALDTTETPQQKRQREYDAISGSIRTLENDIQTYKNRLNTAKTGDERERIQGIINRTQREIDAMRATQQLLNTQMQAGAFRRVGN